MYRESLFTLNTVDFLIRLGAKTTRLSDVMLRFARFTPDEMDYVFSL